MVRPMVYDFTGIVVYVVGRAGKEEGQERKEAKRYQITRSLNDADDGAYLMIDPTKERGRDNTSFDCSSVSIFFFKLITNYQKLVND